MQSSLLNLVDNLSEVYVKECTKCMEIKKIKVNCDFFGFKSGRLNYKCKEYQNHAQRYSKKNFPTLYKCCNGDINKVFTAIKKRYLSL